MRLVPRGAPLPPSDDLATALAVAASHLGHRPAITVLRPGRRDEQGFLSLAQWAAKGAHLLQIECGLGLGERLRLAAPPGWIGAAVCYAAWWAGVAITDADASVSVVHDTHRVPASGDVYVIGDGFDGTPTTDVDAEPWTLAVQTFPDQPPPAAAHPEAVALELDGRRWTHAELVASAASAPTEIASDAPPEVWLAAVARVVVTGETLTIG